jgi:hypothetical protein
MAQAALDGITATRGNVYLEAVAGNNRGDSAHGQPAAAGDLFFTARGAGGPQIVNVGNHVFTAAAEGQLAIDGPNGGVLTTLVSATGVVSSVGQFASFDGRFPDQPSVPKVGPRMVLTPPSLGRFAATSAEVTPPEFLQQIEVAYGSQGEVHFIFEFVWADVRNPPGMPALPASVQGTIDQSELFDLASPSATQQFAHSFAPVFLATNSAFPNLPTLIQMYNDPAINLYALDGSLNLNQTTSQLGVEPELSGNFVSPQFVASVELPPPPASSPAVAQQLEAAPAPAFTPVFHSTRRAQFVSSFSEIRELQFRQLEIIHYGPIDADGKWEAEPQVWTQGRTGNWIEKIKQEIARGAWDLGQKFQIRIETDRGDDIVETWQFQSPNAAGPANVTEQHDGASLPPQQPIRPEAGGAPEGAAAADTSPSAASRRPVAEPTGTGEAGSSTQLGSLGAALALVRLRAERAGRRLSPTQVADALDSLAHHGFSWHDRRRRLADRLRNLTRR